MFRLSLCIAILLAGLASCFAQDQDAAALRKQASSEMNMEKQVQLLCKAADLEPKNHEYRNDCEVRKATLINNDRQALKTALDANDNGQIAKAKRYAKYVSVFDPETHRQAEQLLAKLGGTEAPAAAASPSTTVPSAPGQGALLAQATAAFDSGNLQAARTTAQEVTEPSLKPAADHLLSEIDRYTGYVSAGHKQEQAHDYAEAERSYRAALDLNPHVASDDLTGRTQQMHQLASAAKPTPILPSRNSPGKQVAEVPVEERVRRLLEEGNAAMGRNDINTAGLRFKQALDLAPGNPVATQKLAELTTLLSKDPVRLEKTLREAIVAFYSSHFEDAESRLNRYLGADNGKKKGAAYFYLGATEATLSLLDTPSRRAVRSQEALDNFRQARSAGYLPVEKYVSSRVLGVWKSSGT